MLDATGMAGAPPWLGWVGANSGASSRPFNLAVTSVDRAVRLPAPAFVEAISSTFARTPLPSVILFSKRRSMGDLLPFWCTGARFKKAYSHTAGAQTYVELLA